MTTPLILAIEPDRRQASRLKAIADRLSVQLALVESAAGALEVLDHRLPDLILTPALLSRRDDVALADRLRELGEAAAHIQTLTIPTLEAPGPPSRGGGILSALRREPAREAGPAGCAAETFAEQIAVYLKGAVAARRERTESQVPAVDEPPLMQSSVETIVLVEQDPPVETEPSPAVGENTPKVLVDMPPPASDEAEYTLWPILPIATNYAAEDNTAERDQGDPADDRIFFDPEQYRFIALLAKLDEIAAEP